MILAWNLRLLSVSMLERDHLEEVGMKANSPSRASTRSRRFRAAAALSAPPAHAAISSKRVWASVRSRALARLAVVLCAFALVAPSCNTPTPIGTVTSFRGMINNPYGIAAGPDGNLWFTNDNSIGRITPAGVVSNFTDPTISGPQAIAAGPDGNLWFTNVVYPGYGEPQDSSIGRISPAGVVSSFTGPGISRPLGIAAGPDGNLWFTNYSNNSVGNNSIGRITPAGVVSNFTDPSIGQPHGIAAGPDGGMWFTNHYLNSIGRITAANLR
jgi:streptogramin lyase